MPDLSQDETPFVDAMLEYSARNPGRFQVPGHKGGLGADPSMVELVGMTGLVNDIPSVTEGVDIGPEPTPFQQAQLLAAEAWGAKRSWFLINGASQGNHATSMALGHMGEEVVVQRNVHSSVIDGLVLNGMRPTFVAPELDPELGIAHGLTRDSLAAALAATPNAVAAMVVSPTYFGACADVAALAEVAHSHGVPLICDEAWGAHLHFHPDLPPDALASGADLVTSSTHKIVGSLTQAAMLHLGHGDRIDAAIVDRCVSLVETTSPSGLLSGSLDAARRQAAVHGEAILGETLEAIARTRERILEIPGLGVLDESMVGRAGIAGWDPMRLSVDVRDTGSTGYRLSKKLFYSHGIDLELYSENVVVAIFGLGENATEAGDRLVAALGAAVGELEAEPGPPQEKLAPPPPWGELVMTPREAYLGPQDVIPFEEAAGRIAAEGLAAYPPGIPNVLPGERLTAETLSYIRESIAHGGYVRGGSDRELKTLRVAAEARVRSCAMASYDAVEDLPLTIESCSFEGLEVSFGEFERLTTVVKLTGAGEEGIGEDVVYDPVDHIGQQGHGPPEGLAHSGTFDEFSQKLDGIDLFPAGAPERGDVSRDYRRWAFESAALDLALRQAGTNLSAVLGREPRPLNFVNSLRLGGFSPEEKSTIEPVRKRLAVYPNLRFKLDPFNDWDDELIAALAETGAVDSLDLKGFYKDTPVDVITDPGLYAKLIETFPDAWLEDPDVTDETRPLLDPVRERVTWDAPIHRVADIEAMPWSPPRTVNVKPSRFGPISRLFAAYDYCEERGIGAYGGGQTELGPGRGQIQYLASIFHPATPNDVAPSGYNDPTQATAPGLPTSPLEPSIDAIGFRWTGPQTA